MSYDTYKAPLTLKPAFSLQLLAFIVGLHAIAIIFVLLLMPITLIYTLCLITMVVVSGLYAYRLHIQKSLQHSVEQVMLSVDNQWKVTLANKNEAVTAILLPSSMVHRHLMILNFKLSSGKRRALIIPSDSINKDLARKLRARIKVMGL